MERKISKEKYILAALLTLLIFSLGLTLGILLDSVRLQKSEKLSKQQEIDYGSLQLQYLYLTTFSENEDSCSVLKVALDKSIKDLSVSLEKFDQYKHNSNFNKDEFNMVARRYILDNIKYWLFAQKSQQKCAIDLVTVLYFYSENDCSICPDQGVLLTYYKKIYGEKLLIFPINADLEENEAMITVIKSKYNITQYPTIIIGNKKYEGVVKKQQLGKVICNNFVNKDICYNYKEDNEEDVKTIINDSEVNNS
ncbi:hypothetical protein HZA96_04590 [Candidatus Woesearchaeota archaeon]|nr:hypothetical protein [Candidatus Woesearchaeota archaeon]